MLGFQKKVATIGRFIRGSEIADEQRAYRRRKQLEQDIVDDISHTHSIVITGDSGSGKSYFAKRLIEQMTYMYTPDELRLVLIDPKQVEFIHEKKDFDPDYLQCPVINDPADGLAYLEQLARLSTKGGEGKAHKSQRLFIYIDECDLAQLDKARFEATIETIIGNAKDANMWLVYATSRGNVAGMSDDLLAQFTAVVAYEQMPRAYKEIGASPFAYSAGAVKSR